MSSRCKKRLQSVKRFLCYVEKFCCCGDSYENLVHIPFAQKWGPTEGRGQQLTQQDVCHILQNGAVAFKTATIPPDHLHLSDQFLVWLESVADEI